MMLKKHYSAEEIFTLLKEDGFAVSFDADNDIVIKVDGWAYILFILPDGDLQILFGFGDDFSQVPFSVVNDWNRTKRLSRLYMTEAGHIHLEADMDVSAGVSEEMILQFVKCFVRVSAPDFRQYWYEHYQASLEENLLPLESIVKH